MYNINYYHTNNAYYSYYGNQPYNSQYNYNSRFSNYSADKINHQLNNGNNRVIKLYIAQNKQNYNHMKKSIFQTPIKNSLNNNRNIYPQIKLVSKSPEPYIRFYNQNLRNNNHNHITNLNVKVKKNNSPLNIRINNIHKINKITKITPYNPLNQNIYYSKTPEPNLPRRNRLKQKRIKNRLNNNYIAKTFIPLNTNPVLETNIYKPNYVNKTEYLNTPKYNYINSINKIVPKSKYTNLQNIQNNKIITNYSRVNYYPVINNYNQYEQIKYNGSLNSKGKNYIINLKTPRNDSPKKKAGLFNLQIRHYVIHPKSNFNSEEFIIINSIGEGSFGKIYCVQWIKNNKLYAMKKLDIQSLEELNELKGKVSIVDNLFKITKHPGFVQIYADKVVPLYNQQFCYNYYIIMELGERDWEKEIQLRLIHQKYYTEYELYQIIYQLVKTLSIMQQNNVTHRDIKPANVLIMNGFYKICDFGEATIINGNGVVIQNVRGSQLFMSPILFYAYNHQISQVMHNTYKSDVYSFGMCILLAASLSGYTLNDIRELLNINEVARIINNKLRERYSINFINLLIQMLQIDENLRMDFIQLENYIMRDWKY